LEYFRAIWDILWPFGTVCVRLVHFLRLWSRKIWQPCLKETSVGTEFVGAVLANSFFVLVKSLSVSPSFLLFVEDFEDS
jgi:hypothetical protein